VDSLRTRAQVLPRACNRYLRGRTFADADNVTPRVLEPPPMVQIWRDTERLSWLALPLVTNFTPRQASGTSARAGNASAAIVQPGCEPMTTTEIPRVATNQGRDQGAAPMSWGRGGRKLEPWSGTSSSITKRRKTDAVSCSSP
jgi:hypothetical protein